MDESVSAVAEPSNRAMMLIGFATVGFAVLPPEFKARLSLRLKRDYNVNLERPPQGGFSVL